MAHGVDCSCLHTLTSGLGSTSSASKKQGCEWRLLVLRLVILMGALRISGGLWCLKTSLSDAVMPASKMIMHSYARMIMIMQLFHLDSG